MDVGGVFLLPSPEPIIGVLERAEIPVDAARLDRAHYAGAASSQVDVDDDEAPIADFWRAYLTAFTAECGVPGDRIDEAIEHLASEFATDGLWMRVIPGSVDALRAIADAGIRLGVVSNAGGTMADRLRELEVLQVGAGMGVEVETLIDSGAVGVEKPDPRIFHMALEALDVEPEQHRLRRRHAPLRRRRREAGRLAAVPDGSRTGSRTAWRARSSRRSPTCSPRVVRACEPVG